MTFSFILRQIKKNFSLDLRSLTLFRVLVSSLVIIDFLFTRLPYFTLFYTDKGMLPMKDFSTGVFTSLNFVSTNCGYQIALFILTIFCFSMLLVGYKTKLATFGAWILYLSFINRNSLIASGGNTLLLLTLFWSLGLPLNRYFSIDSALTKEKQKTTTILSINSLAFICQILIIYYFTYILKTGEVWKNGQGVYYALMMYEFRTPWGDILLQYPTIMEILTNLTLYLESLVPLLFILFGGWWPFRLAIILIMCGFHLSLNLFLDLGFFQWTSIVVWSALLPTEFWEKIKTITLLKKNHPLTVYFDGECSFCKKSIALIKTFLILPQHVTFLEAQSNPQALSEMEKRNSWLVSHNQREYQDRWNVWTSLLSYSPLFFYLAPLLRIKIFSIPGNWFYKKISSNRQKLNHLLPNFQSNIPRPSNLLSFLFSVFFFCCFIYVLMWNVRTLEPEYQLKYTTSNIQKVTTTEKHKHYLKYFPPKSWEKGFGVFLNLNQLWNLFALQKNQIVINGWIVLFAIQSDNSETKQIDLLTGKPTTLEPNKYSKVFPVAQYSSMMRSISVSQKHLAKNVLSYLCNKHNKKLMKTGKHIYSIEWIYMKQNIPPFGEKLPEPEKIIVHKQICLKLT